jgi:malonate transporter
LTASAGAIVSTSFAVLLPALFVLLLGYGAGWAKKFKPDQVSGITEVVLDFALPAALFVGIVTIPRTSLLQDASFFLAILAGMAAVYVLALVVSKFVFHLDNSSVALFSLSAAFPSAPFFGPAILGGLFGAASSVTISAVAIFGNLILVPASTVLLEISRATNSGIKAPTPRQSPTASENTDAAHPPTPVISPSTTGTGNANLVVRSLIQTIKTPYVWAPLFGLVLVLIGVPVPSLVKSSLSEIGTTAAGLALFVAGLVLAAHSVKVGLIVSINTVLKSLIMPAVLLGLVFASGIHGELASEAVVAAALPSATIGTILASRYKTYQSEAGSTLLMTSFLILAVVPLFLILVSAA